LTSGFLDLSETFLIMGSRFIDSLDLENSGEMLFSIGFRARKGFFLKELRQG